MFLLVLLVTTTTALKTKIRTFSSFFCCAVCRLSLSSCPPLSLKFSRQNLGVLFVWGFFGNTHIKVGLASRKPFIISSSFVFTLFVSKASQAAFVRFWSLEYWILPSSVVLAVEIFTHFPFFPFSFLSIPSHNSSLLSFLVDLLSTNT